MTPAASDDRAERRHWHSRLAADARPQAHRHPVPRRPCCASCCSAACSRSCCGSSSSRPDNALVDAHTYNQLFTQHGIVMVWLFMIPSIPSAFGNFLLPLMIGAQDVAFPRLNLASYYDLRRRRHRRAASR